MVLIKSQIKHKLDGKYLTGVLDLEIETSVGNINIATTYLPSRRPFIPFPDFHRLASKNTPAYLMGDLNVSSLNLGSTLTNQTGRQLDRMLNMGKLHHLGPDFSTFHARNSHTTPNIILYNYKVNQNITFKLGQITLSDHIPIIKHSVLKLKIYQLY